VLRCAKRGQLIETILWPGRELCACGAGCQPGCRRPKFFRDLDGRLAGLLCRALSITSNTTAIIVYVNGVGMAARATQYRRTARISGKALSWGSPTVTFEFTQKGPSTLSGVRNSGWGSETEASGSAPLGL
jgi:hypothetical protein